MYFKENNMFLFTLLTDVYGPEIDSDHERLGAVVVASSVYSER